VDRKKKLAIAAANIPTLGQNRVKPSVYFKLIAHPISMIPAVIKNSQAIFEFSSVRKNEIDVERGPD
jgi:hypothetical protein